MDTTNASDTTTKRGGRRLYSALTDKTVRAAKAPGRMFDGHGLFLLVHPGGAKGWRQRITVNGRRQELSLGAFPVVTLREAREAALANLRMVHAGLNPEGRAAPLPAASPPSPNWPAPTSSTARPDGATPSTPRSGSALSRNPPFRYSASARLTPSRSMTCSACSPRCGTNGRRRRSGCANASRRCWRWRWRRGIAPTIPRRPSRRCSPSISQSRRRGTAQSPAARWRVRWRRSEHREHVAPRCSQSSFWY